MKKKYSVLILFTLLAWVLVVALLEGGARLLVKFSPRATRKIEILVPDPVLHHRFRPNLKGVQADSNSEFGLYTNRQGWVERYDVQRKKPKNTYRVFYVGDSNVQGLVDEPEKMVEIVERNLNQLYAHQGKKIEVINTGTSSYSIIIYYLLIKTELLNYNPDLVVINVDMTDVPNDYYYRQFQVSGVDHRPLRVGLDQASHGKYRLTPRGTIEVSPVDQIKEWLVYHSDFVFLWSHLLSLPRLEIPVMKRELEKTPADWLALEWDDKIISSVYDSMEVLGWTVELLQKKGVKVLVTSVPHYPQFKGDWSSKPHKILETTARKHNCPFLNGYKTLFTKIAVTPQETYYFKFDPTHFNAAGNKLWAGAQLDLLLQSGAALLPKKTYKVSTHE